MSLALWTTGDANLYLPVIQTSSILKRPKNVMTVICGILGTILGLGLYQYFFAFLALLASIVPPLIGPVIVEYYFVNKEKFHTGHFEDISKWNPAAFIAYILGAVSTFYSPDWGTPSLIGLLVSMLVYLIVRMSLKTKVWLFLGHHSRILVRSGPSSAGPTSASQSKKRQKNDQKSIIKITSGAN